jgi:hypothetical protein
MQPDLFGDFDIATRSAANEAAERDEWAYGFTRPRYRLAYDCGLGSKGDVLIGVQCPTCGGVEVNDSLLSTNHGWDPTMPGWQPAYSGTVECTRLWLRRSQNESAARSGRPLPNHDTDPLHCAAVAEVLPDE